MRKHLWCVVLAAVLICITVGPAVAQGMIRSSGAGSFIYDGHVYVPVRSTGDYLGARSAWDPYANRMTVAYNDRNLTLVVGTTSAYYNDEPVHLDGPVVMVRDQLYAPASAFDRYLGAPMRWEPRLHRASFQGPPGWGYYDVNPYAPSYAQGTFASYGYVPSYAPTPFMYGGATYLPLRSVADVIGAVLLFDLLGNRGVVTYGGVQTVMYIGNPNVYYGNRVIALSAAPIISNNVVYVPAGLVENYWRVPVRHTGGRFEVQGDRGWHSFNVRSAPPSRIYRSMAAAPFLRSAGAGLRSVGMTRPMDPGLVSRGAHVSTNGRTGTVGHAKGGPATGFPALAATRPHGGAVAASPRGAGKVQGGAAATRPRGAGKVQGGAAATRPRGAGKVQGGAAATRPRGAGKVQGGAAAASPRGSGKAQGGRPQAKGGKDAQPKAGGGQGHGGGK